MAITLHWGNGNTDAASIAVYRYTTNDPNYQSTVEPPIATIPGGSTEYVDTTAVAGNTYFYALKTTMGGKSVWTPLINGVNTRQRGPGPNSLKYGNERLGYFGTVAASELPMLLDRIATSNGGTATLSKPWHKFIRKGKIYYVSGWFPASAPFTAASIMTEYGIDNGIDWGVAVPAWVTSGKNTIVEKNGFKYRPRFPRGCPDTWRPDLPNAFAFDNFVTDPTTEFNEIVMPIFSESPYPHPFGSIAVYDTTLQQSSNGVFCAERSNLTSETNLLHRVSGGTYNSTFSSINSVANSQGVLGTTQTACKICFLYELYEG